MGFRMKVPLFKQFTPFLDFFMPFFLQLEVFNLDHENRLIKC